MAEAINQEQALEQHEVVIIGAGVCGIYMMHRMQELGVDATVLEAGGDLGGTWYWNRYPGARFDSESYSYGYSFDEKILEEWNWSEHFAAQPETLRYLNFVADRLGVRPYMQFNCRVIAAAFDEASNTWTVTLQDGRVLRCNVLLTAIGMLSAATLPRIEGVDSFQGQAFHTYYWPQEPVELAGKKVAVIGTGATGVQVIGEIADKVGELVVYQRRPNWCAPLHNGPIDDETMSQIKASYDEIFAKCAATPGGFLHGPDRRSFAEVPEEERLAFWEELYASPGFGIWLGNFRDVLTDFDVNAEFSAFIAEKIRQRVKDPAVADKLIPKDHGFGSRRVPMETHYYEAYNRDNVTLVDVNETPIERITPRGIKTRDQEREFDIIIYATGFDAITGAFDRIEFTGTGGHKLSDKWRDGPITYLGVSVAGFPNMFTLAGPQGASVSSNFPPNIEFAVNWATALLEYMREHGYSRVETTPEAESQWIEEIKAGYEGSLLATAKSWFTGYNSNVDGHDKLRYMMYLLGSPKYRQRLDAVAERGYEGFNFE
jgi:cation diffusion facilitator CzcD-associated flavoprotein CzcO